MPTRGVTVPPTTRSIASYVKKNAVHVKKAQKHKHSKAESVREADYKGHHIVIRTQYEIEVDSPDQIKIVDEDKKDDAKAEKKS